MEICHFFVFFYDCVMKCVYKSTIYTFVIRDKIWTPPFVVQKCTCYFCVLGPENTPPPPHPIHVRHFCVSPPPPGSADTDLIAILLEFMPQFKLRNDHIRIWCDFGTGVTRKATSINSIYERLGKALCLALPFFHVFSSGVT